MQCCQAYSLPCFIFEGGLPTDCTAQQVPLSLPCFASAACPGRVTALRRQHSQLQLLEVACLPAAASALPGHRAYHDEKRSSP